MPNIYIALFNDFDHRKCVVARAFFLLDSEKSIFKCDRIYILSRNLVSISHFEVNENVPRERSTTVNPLFCRLIEFGMGTDLILRECFFFSAALYGQEMLDWFLGHDRNGVNFAIFRGKKGKFRSPVAPEDNSRVETGKRGRAEIRINGKKSLEEGATAAQIRLRLDLKVFAASD